MNIEQNECTSAADTLCKACNKFYGSEAFGGYCSGCFRQTQKSLKQIGDTKGSESPEQIKTLINSHEQDEPQQIASKPVQVDRKRCFHCRKKVGLLGIECKCGFVFCNGHRMPENHDCTFDYQSKAQLAKQMVKVCNGKIQEI